MPRQISQCPLCDAPLVVSEVSCTGCAATVRGAFTSAPLSRLSADQQRFAETFLLCRGVIRDVERELGVSYPTVRARLDGVVSALETVLQTDPPSVPRPTVPEPDDLRRRLLRDVQDGRISPADAIDALHRL